MSTTQTTNAWFDPAELDAWITTAHGFVEEKVEQIKSDPQFLEWAAEHVGPNRETPHGMIPGWTLDDCARLWFRHHHKDEIPTFPAPAGWKQDIAFAGFEEFGVNLTTFEGTIPGTDIEVTVEMLHLLSWGDEKDESIRDAMTLRPHIKILGDVEALQDPTVARQLAALLSKAADTLDAAFVA